MNRRQSPKVAPYRPGDPVLIVHQPGPRLVYETTATVERVVELHDGRWRITVPRPGPCPTAEYVVDDTGVHDGRHDGDGPISPLGTPWIRPHTTAGPARWEGCCTGPGFVRLPAEMADLTDVQALPGTGPCRACGPGGAASAPASS